MKPNLHSFVTELVKLSAFPQQEQDSDPYDATSGMSAVMDSTQGAGAKAGLKSGGPVQTANAPKKLAPTPLTTPNAMVDVASKS
jgi:hypothetical protein